MWVHSRDWWERVVPKEFRDGEWREKLWSGLKSVCEEREASVPGLRAG